MLNAGIAPYYAEEVLKNGDRLVIKLWVNTNAGIAPFDVEDGLRNVYRFIVINLYRSVDK